MSARPFAVGGRLAVPSAYIAAELGSVGAPLVGALAEGRHEACPYLVIELLKVGSCHPAWRRPVLQVRETWRWLREFRSYLRKAYGEGRWRKMKGTATVRLANGALRVVELH
jgi:hypothetical protein